MAIFALSHFNVDVYGLECKNQPVNATLMGGRRRGTVVIAWMCFTCCSSEVLQLIMTEVVWVFNDAIQITKCGSFNVYCARFAFMGLSPLNYVEACLVSFKIDRKR